MSEPEPNPSPDAAGADEPGKMSFFDHLTELRTRIVWSLIPSAIGLGISLYFTTAVMKFLTRDLKTELVFTTPTEAFWTYMKVAMIMGIFIAMPIILWNVWAFVAPGLHKHERKYAAPFVIVGSLLFIAGGAFALFVIVPFAISFLVTFGQEQGLKAMITVSSYVDFILKFTLAFGVVFEMPVVITLLSMLGIVTPQFLSKNRKWPASSWTGALRAATGADPDRKPVGVILSSTEPTVARPGSTDDTLASACWTEGWLAG